MVRLAFHAAGTYSADGTGGSNGGRLRFSPESTDPASAGLQRAVRSLLPFTQGNYTGIVTMADLITLAGVTAVEVSGGPVISAWRAGRTDALNGKTSPPNGRLPEATRDAAHIKDVFARLGFTPEETVALLGAHVLGGCHPQNSGFVGPWVRNNRQFTNAFFR